MLVDERIKPPIIIDAPMILPIVILSPKKTHAYAIEIITHILLQRKALLRGIIESIFCHNIAKTPSINIAITKYVQYNKDKKSCSDASLQNTPDEE